MAPFELECAPVLIDGRTFVPVSFFEEVLDAAAEIARRTRGGYDAIIGRGILGIGQGCPAPFQAMSGVSGAALTGHPGIYKPDAMHGFAKRGNI